MWLLELFALVSACSKRALPGKQGSDARVLCAAAAFCQSSQVGLATLVAPELSPEWGVLNYPLRTTLDFRDSLGQPPLQRVISCKGCSCIP